MAPESDPSKRTGKEFIAHQPTVKIEDLDFFENHAVVSEWEDGLQKLRVIDMKSNKSHEMKFPEPVYAVSLENRTVNSTLA